MHRCTRNATNSAKSNRIIYAMMTNRGSRFIINAAMMFALLLSVNRANFANTMTPSTTFSDDLLLLEKHFSPIELRLGKTQRLVLLGELQGRVAVGSLSGGTGESIGWFDRSKLQKVSFQSTENARLAAGIDGSIGGAGRTWLGPDGGTFSLFFEKHAERVAENIRVPDAINTQPYRVVEQSDTSASFEQHVSFNNHMGFDFKAKVEHTVRLMPLDDAKSLVGTTIPNSIKILAYMSQTTVTNTNIQSWTEDTGLFSIWSLAMLAPNAVVVMPLSQKINQPATSYFRETSATRQKVTNKAVYYLADAMSMDKIGIPAAASTPWMASYHPTRQLLTLTHIGPSPSSTAAYVNADWNEKEPVLAGESHNLFNDGPRLNNRQFGSFFELESSSPALILNPNDSQTHTYTVLHLNGSVEDLSSVSKAVLNLSIEQLTQTYNELLQQTTSDHSTQ